MPTTLTPQAMNDTLTGKATSHRLHSIDLLRGLVMIIMALDHVRDLTHQTAMTADPNDFSTTTPVLFFTRWITHFCAPVFVFLAGTSVFLQGQRKSKKELSLFAIKRGLWLILVELTVVTFGISFDPGFSFLFLQVIWAIGISMVLLGLAVWLPFPVIFATGVVIVVGHNSLDFYEIGKQGFSLLYSLLHRQNFIPIEGSVLAILYPFLPWTGVMFLGYCFGQLITAFEGRQRKRVLVQLGLGLVLLFIGLRAINIYGDPAPWAGQKTPLFTVLSFLNTTKYPPSLLFLCMTIGPALVFLAFAGNARNRLAAAISIYGRVPFFYYILHFYLIHLTAMVLSLLRGHSFAEGATGVQGLPFKFVFPGEGLPLSGVYLVWALLVALLYPACRWFSHYKQTHKQWWLHYL